MKLQLDARARSSANDRGSGIQEPRATDDETHALGIECHPKNPPAATFRFVAYSRRAALLSQLYNALFNTERADAYVAEMLARSAQQLGSQEQISMLPNSRQHAVCAPKPCAPTRFIVSFSSLKLEGRMWACLIDGLSVRHLGVSLEAPLAITRMVPIIPPSSCSSRWQ